MRGRGQGPEAGWSAPSATSARVFMRALMARRSQESRQRERSSARGSQRSGADQKRTVYFIKAALFS